MYRASLAFLPKFVCYVRYVHTSYEIEVFKCIYIASPTKNEIKCRLGEPSVLH